MIISNKSSLPWVLCLLLLACVPATTAQRMPNQQLQPISLSHLYWHFLIHQSFLDTMAARLQAEGKNGNAFRNDLQNRLGFSDADYAPIRTSSQRLASELKALNDQMKALGTSHSDAVQMQTFIQQRDAYVNNEIYNLSIELSPQQKAALEKFMTSFFAPKQLTVTPFASGSHKEVRP